MIELLVVIFIIGIMLSLLLPALSGARGKASNTMCMNNLRNLQLALRQSIDATKKFPLPNRWTVDVLRWIDEEPLYRELYNDLKDNFDPNAKYGRPVLMVCPFQDDFPSRVENVGFCHYILTANRPLEARPEKVKWQIHDREILSADVVEQPWHTAPEQDFETQRVVFEKKPGPHEDGKFMTSGGTLVP